MTLAAELLVCTTSGCHQPSVVLFTWPGRDEAGMCAEHVGKLRAVADAMGLYIQIKPIEPESE